uniref:RWD domain-containing protein n=1 Tax=Panagrolaimus superbus TaxID=310955 RepID=A0A914YFH9_9BILA
MDLLTIEDLMIEGKIKDINDLEIYCHLITTNAVVFAGIPAEAEEFAEKLINIFHLINFMKMLLSQESEEEITAVSSIFYDIITVESDRTILCSFPSFNIDIRFTLTIEYPEKSSPIIEVCGPSVSAEIKHNLKERLENICNDKLGDLILYDCITSAKEFIDVLKLEVKNEKEMIENGNVSSDSNKNKEELKIKVPEIYGTDTLTDRKSIFQAHVARINSKEEAMAVLETLMSNSKIARATHRIYAYRTYVTKNDKKLPLNDCADDGETGAGIKLQHLLQIMKIDNVMLVVTRWYGGIHLGADRFKHIQNKARQAIKESGIEKEQTTN